MDEGPEITQFGRDGLSVCALMPALTPRGGADRGLPSASVPERHQESPTQLILAFSSPAIALVLVLHGGRAIGQRLFNNGRHG